MIVCHTKWCIIYGYMHATQLLGSTECKWTLVSSPRTRPAYTHIYTCTSSLMCGKNTNITTRSLSSLDNSPCSRKIVRTCTCTYTAQIQSRSYMYFHVLHLVPLPVISLHLMFLQLRTSLHIGIIVTLTTYT